MIMQLINYFIGSFFISVATYYVAVKIRNIKFELFNINVIIYLLLESLLLMLLYVFIFNNVFRISFNVLVLMLFYKIIFKDSIIRNIVISFFTFSMVIVSEICIVIIFKNFMIFSSNYSQQSLYMTLYTNLIVSLLLVFLINIKHILCIFRKMTSNDFINKFYSIVLIICCFSICLSSLLYYIFFEINPLNSFFITFILSICYIIIPIIILKEKIENEKLKIKYDIVLKNIDEYEDNLNEQRIKNHENKNMLISIRSMIEKNDENTINFINQILKDNRFVEEQGILAMTKNIPVGGLQGLIYQKFVIINNKKIKWFLNIDKKLKKSIFKNLPLETIKNICMIIGVFLDNAIEEVETQNNPLIGLDIYMDKLNIFVEVSNSYNNISDIVLFDKKGFSTKSNGHGYGLSLVKELLERDKHLINKRIINGNIFTQKLIIKKF